MKRVYIAGPIRKGDLLNNIDQADRAVAALMKAGIAFYNPMWSCYAGGTVGSQRHLYSGQQVACVGRADSSFGSIPFDAWLENDFAWIRVCDALLRLPGESEGADKEVMYARSLGLQVFSSAEAVIASFAPPLPMSPAVSVTAIPVGSTGRSICFVGHFCDKPVGSRYRTREPNGSEAVKEVVERWAGRVCTMPLRVIEWAYAPCYRTIKDIRSCWCDEDVVVVTKVKRVA